MRKRLEKLEVPIYPRIRAQRAVLMARRLAKLTAPRVVAAVLRTLWNGWCTKRRFGSQGRCLFCGCQKGDALEHISVCRTLAQFGTEHLRLQYHGGQQHRRMAFLLLDPPSELSDERLTLGALRVAASYQLHCKFRRRPDSLDGEGVVRRALEQSCKELVQGHERSLSVYDKRWVRT